MGTKNRDRKKLKISRTAIANLGGTAGGTLTPLATVIQVSVRVSAAASPRVSQATVRVSSKVVEESAHHVSGGGAGNSNSNPGSAWCGPKI